MLDFNTQGHLSKRTHSESSDTHPNNKKLNNQPNKKQTNKRKYINGEGKYVTATVLEC